MKLPVAVCYATGLWSEPTRVGDRWESELFLAMPGYPDQTVGQAAGRNRVTLRFMQAYGVLRVLVEFQRQSRRDSE